MRICGIGSRKTPPQILREMTTIGNWCRQNKIYLTSGHAEGADFAFESGAREYCLVYLPWRGFNINSKYPMLGNPCVVEFNPELDILVKEFHPNPDKLNRGPWALIRRNGCQVLGLNLDQPVNCVVCWTLSDDEGGTGQAIRIARCRDIPVVNMNSQEFRTAIQVIKVLEKLIH